MPASVAKASRAKRPESSLLRPTLLGLLRLRWVSQMSLADTEVHWHGKRIDLAFSPVASGADPAAIELKVASTRRAIEQAALNRYLTPSSWVATWTPPTEPLIEHAGEEGVGLMLVSERGAYPLLYPRHGALHTNALAQHLCDQQRRVRDILSELRHG